MKNKLAIFDLDGTLLNSLQEITNSVNYAMEKLHCNTYTSEQLKSMVNYGALHLMQSALPSDKQNLVEDAIRYRHEYYDKFGYVTSQPFPDIVEMLADLQERGIKLAVFTNKHEDIAQKICNTHFPMLNYVLGTTTYGVKKPEPDGIFTIAKTLNTDVSNCILVGDSHVDIVTAHNAKINSVAVTWGFETKQQLQKHNPTYIVDSVAELQQTTLRFTLQ